MWAKGPMPGYSPRSDALRLCSSAVCRKKTALGITGYVVYESEGGKPVASAGSAQDAWRKAAARFADASKRIIQLEVGI